MWWFHKPVYGWWNQHKWKLLDAPVEGQSQGPIQAGVLENSFTEKDLDVLFHFNEVLISVP